MTDLVKAKAVSREAGGGNWAIPTSHGQLPTYRRLHMRESFVQG